MRSMTEIDFKMYEMIRINLILTSLFNNRIELKYTKFDEIDKLS